MEKLIAILMGLCLFVFFSLFFVKFGWSLFMVPVFGLREIGYSEAAGLSLLAAAFKPSSISWGKK